MKLIKLILIICTLITFIFGCARNDVQNVKDVDQFFLLENKMVNYGVCDWTWIYINTQSKNYLIGGKNIKNGKQIIISLPQNEVNKIGNIKNNEVVFLNIYDDHVILSNDSEVHKKIKM